MADQPVYVWRTTLKRRLARCVGALLLWAVAIEARLVYLQVVRYAELSRAPNGSSRAPSKRRPSAARSSIATVTSWPTAWTPTRSTPCPPRSTIRHATTAALCGALADCDAKDRQALADRIRKGKYFAYVRRQVSPEQAARVAALQLDGIGFIKESQRFYPNRSWRRTCSATSASTTTAWAASRPRTTRFDPRPRRHGAGADRRPAARRSAASSGRRRRARRSS